MNIKIERLKILQKKLTLYAQMLQLALENGWYVLPLTITSIEQKEQIQGEYPHAHEEARKGHVVAHETMDAVVDVTELAEEILPKTYQGSQVRHADEKQNQFL